MGKWFVFIYFWHLNFFEQPLAGMIALTKPLVFTPSSPPGTAKKEELKTSLDWAVPSSELLGWVWKWFWVWFKNWECNNVKISLGCLIFC